MRGNIPDVMKPIPASQSVIATCPVCRCKMENIFDGLKDGDICTFFLACENPSCEAHNHRYALPKIMLERVK